MTSAQNRVARRVSRRQLTREKAGELVPLITDLQLYEAILRALHPRLAACLQPPASVAALLAFTRQLGTSLPDELAALFLWHDGQRVSRARTWIGETHVFGTWTLASIRDVAARRRLMMPTAGPPSEGMNDPRLTQAYWAHGWIPVFRTDKDYVACDLEPGPQGRRGQMVDAKWGDRRSIAAPSLTAWIAQHLATLRSGQIDLYVALGDHPMPWDESEDHSWAPEVLERLSLAYRKLEVARDRQVDPITAIKIRAASAILHRHIAAEVAKSFAPNKSELRRILAEVREYRHGWRALGVSGHL